VIRDWFRLVRNTITKYGIVESDIWNFDETGFLMGQITSTLVITSSERRGKTKVLQPGDREWATLITGISSSGCTIPPFIIVAAQMHLESWYRENPFPSDWVIAVSENGWTTDEITFQWLEHFEEHTSSKTKGKYRLLVLDGHGSHHTAQFEEFCRDHSIITLCMPAHSSHILQPLDVGCFSPLKTAYGHQVEGLMRLGVNHISKEEFLPAYLEAHKASFTTSNIQAGFAATGLVPDEPERVLSALDPVVRTPSPVPSAESLWESKTPHTI